MNPLGLLVVALGILLVIVGVKGSQHSLVSALTNRATGQTTATGAPAQTSSAQPSKGTLV